MDNDLSNFDEKVRKHIEEIFRIHQETSVYQRDADRILKETTQSQKENARMIKDLRRQMGEWGNKWGGFTEGMAYPSMVKVLTEQFELDQFAPNLQSRRGGGTLEIDVLGYANGGINRACIVEVKSRLREEGIEQLLRILDQFGEFFPEHKGKTVYGILAAVHVPDDLARRLIKEGLFLARISDDTFQLNVPEGFQPRAWGPRDDQLLLRERAPVYQLLKDQ